MIPTHGGLSLDEQFVIIHTEYDAHTNMALFMNSLN